MRGALPHRDQRVHPRGIIPAYAGSTPSRPSSDGSRRDHPRVCGEHMLPAPVPMVTVGSSPRMRGAHVERHRRLANVGIIPAYAGSTEGSDIDVEFTGDHPRVCGEHPPTYTATWCASGSSPRMRGALATLVSRAKSGGIIPAYAGSTPRTSAPGALLWDHPRVCGEHVKPSDCSVKM